MRKAFTLAEVLITLGIIGVVAAMTLPSLVNRIHNKDLEARFKRAYSILSQALLLMKSEENVEINKDTYPSGSLFIQDFYKYFIKYSKCNNKQCGLISMASKIKPKTYNSAVNMYLGFMDDVAFIAASDMDVFINAMPDTYGFLLTVDVNSLNKRPNKAGHDIFVFQIMDSKLVPLGAPGTYFRNDDDHVGIDGNLNPDKYCNMTSQSSYNGFTCSMKAISDKDFFTQLPK